MERDRRREPCGSVRRWRKAPGWAGSFGGTEPSLLRLAGRGAEKRSGGHCGGVRPDRRRWCPALSSDARRTADSS